MKAAMTDEELIRVYFPNQPSYCFAILYKRYYQTIDHQCQRLRRNAEQAQDFSQDVFMKVFDKLGSYAQRSRFATPGVPGGFIQLLTIIAGMRCELVNGYPQRPSMCTWK